jgi:hypothetical protein
MPGMKKKRHEEETRCWRKLAGLLIALELQRRLGRTGADRLRDRGAVKRFPLQVIEHVLGGVVLGAPRRVSLVADVDVHVDHGGHDRLAGQLDMCGAGRRRHGASPADGTDVSVLDDEGAVVDRRARIADDQACAFIDDRGRGTARLGVCNCAQRSHRDATGDEPHRVPL